VCGASTTGLDIAEGPGFEYNPSLSVQSGLLTQDIIMPAFVETIVGCQILTIEVDTDNDPSSVLPPTEVSL
jgi:hypothetical protein